VGRLTGDPGLREVARAIRRTPTRPGTRDLIMDGLAALYSDGYATAVPLRQQAIRALLSTDISGAAEPRLLWLAANAAAELWDHESWNALTARLVRMVRDAGALSELPLVLNSRIVALLFAGEKAAAAALVEEVRAVQEATGSSIAPYGAMVHAALQGRETPARELIDATITDVGQRGEGIGAMVAFWAMALLNNGLGRHEEALAPARKASAYPVELGPASWGAIELVEAAVRCGETRIAGAAFERLTETTGATGTDWALGVESRSRALLGAGDTDEHYRRAIDHLARTRLKVELARTHLLYGEWLRSEGRRTDARTHLRTAHDQFTSVGADGFGERARRELVATGEAVRTRGAPDTREELTAQETEIARLAALRRTNHEIGVQLFISPRTVEWHLRKVFGKLGIRSRRQLRAALPGAVITAVPV
jgi:DNA-binding CsgD family transcriptional regulator